MLALEPARLTETDLGCLDWGLSKVPRLALSQRERGHWQEFRPGWGTTMEFGWDQLDSGQQKPHLRGLQSRARAGSRTCKALLFLHQQINFQIRSSSSIPAGEGFGRKNAGVMEQLRLGKVGSNDSLRLRIKRIDVITLGSDQFKIRAIARLKSQTG